MKIVVIGGCGLIGSKLVPNFRRNGEEVIPASLSNGVDTVTGTGLEQMLADARIVLDLASSSSSDGERLLEAEATAGVGHHIALSIVGVDRNPDVDYFRAKMAQERLIKASGLPYTIVRATQLFESIGYIAQVSAVGDTVHASPALVQPIASDDVAAILADVALGAPANGTIEIAGPERLPLDDIIERYLVSRHDRRQVIGNAHARYFGLELNDKSLTPGPNPRIGPTRFDDWLTRIKK